MVCGMLLATAVFGQSLPDARVLQPGTVRNLTVPNFSFYGEPMCDQDGNVFFHLDTGRYSDVELFKLSRAADRGTTFKPSEEHKKPVFNSFAVSPSGKPYVMVDSPEGTFLMNFKSDGNEEGWVRIGIPDNLHVKTFGVFNDGGVVLSGYFNRYAPEELQGKNFVAVYDPAGRLVRSFKGDFGKTDFSDIKKLPESGVTVGGDGNAYFLGTNEILVVSESGNLVRRLTFKKPNQQMVVTRLNVSKGLLALVLMTYDPKKRSATRRYMVLDSTSGDVMGLYEPAPDLGDEDICFTQDDGFTFFRVDEAKKLTKVDAPLR